MKKMNQFADRWRNYSIFLFFLLGITSSFAQQNPLELFPEYEKREEQRERFIIEIIQLDSVLQYTDYQDKIQLLKFENINIELKDSILKIEFPELFCRDYKVLLDEDKLKHIQKLKDEGKLSLYCRGVASDMDVLPQRTGNIKKDCETYLASIKKVINKNKKDLDGLTFDGYMEMERNEKITTDSKLFLFRKRFLQFLRENYYVTIE